MQLAAFFNIFVFEGIYSLRGDKISIWDKYQYNTDYLETGLTN